MQDGQSEGAAYVRYAVYWLPEADEPLCDFGARWLGHDPVVGFRAPTLTENTQTSSLTFATLTGSPGGVSVIFQLFVSLPPAPSSTVTEKEYVPLE